MGRLADWMATLGIEVLKPVVVLSTDTTKEVVFKTVRMYVGEEVKIEDGLEFADRAIFEDDDPSDIAEMLERSFRVRIPRREFKTVCTVGDMVQLFDRYRGKGTQPDA